MKMCRVECPRGKVILYFPKLWEPQWPMWAPLDMYAIATALMHEGYEVLLIDERNDPDPREWLARELDDALFVGLTAKLGDQCRHMDAAARFVKERRPDCPVVLGGWFGTLYPDAVFECPNIDVLVIGPGDFNVTEVARRLEVGESMAGITGIWAREKGEVVRNPVGHLPDIGRTHSVDYERVGIARYVHPHGWVNFFTSRGCPGGCNFCAIYCHDPHKWTAMPAERVVDEMERLVALGAKALKVMDTDFCADLRRVESICRLVLERRLEVRFEVLGRHWNLCRMTDAQIRLLRAAGCTEIEMGVETGSQRLSDMINKQVPVDQVEGTIRRFVRNGIRIKINVMMGIPTETKQDLIDSCRITHRVRMEHGNGMRLQLFRYTPLPDAPLNQQVWAMETRGHDGTMPRTYEELLEFPVVDDRTEMFWLDERHERDVWRCYDFYAPLSYYRASLDPHMGPRWWRWVLRGLRVLARWRCWHGFYSFPFEMWLNARCGKPMPRGDDDGAGPPEEVLPTPFMGETWNPAPPLESPALRPVQG